MVVSCRVFRSFIDWLQEFEALRALWDSMAFGEFP